MNEFPDWLASTLASDATAGRGVLPPWIGSLKPDARAVGPAFVALMSQDDNLSVREAIKSLAPARIGPGRRRWQHLAYRDHWRVDGPGDAACWNRCARYRWPGARCQGNSAVAAVQCMVPRCYASRVKQTGTRSVRWHNLSWWRYRSGWRPGHRRRRWGCDLAERTHR
jgi:hypothetical protein